MTEPHATYATALIPMPALTPAALRSAIAQIAPSQLVAFGAHLDQAAEQAATQSTIAPLRSFLQYWGEYVAIHRLPERAALLRRLESDADSATDMAALTRAAEGIQQILTEARDEATA